MSLTKYLWSPETGIADLPADWRLLAVPEVASIATIWNEQRDRLKGSEQLRRFTERLSREWAIETGIIENLYEIERGVTQTLIERGFQAALLEHGSTNKPRDYVIRLLKDQQDALEGLFAFVSQRRNLTTSYIKELHAALCRSQDEVEALDAMGNRTMVPLVCGAYKTLPNYPQRDGVTFMYCPPEQTASEMDRLVELHNCHIEEGVPPEVEAAWLHHVFTVIHPFQDGNGRVARAIASLVLIQQGLFPLVVTRDDKVAYLDALEAADGGDLAPLVQVFAKLQRVQFRKATAVSETLLNEGASVRQSLQGLADAIRRKQLEHQQKLEGVFDYASVLEDDTSRRLGELVGDIQRELKSLVPGSRVIVDRSDERTGFYFRGQIVEMARRHLGYFADTGPYRSWVRMRLNWSRRAQVVFAFHSLGARFSGVLVVGPFLEYRDEEGDGDPRSTIVNIASEPFEFYYNERLESIRERYARWLEGVLTATLADIQQNL